MDSQQRTTSLATVKNNVNNTAVITKEDCMRRIRTAFEELNSQSVMRASIEELLSRCKKCLEVQGHQFQNLLK